MLNVLWVLTNLFKVKWNASPAAKTSLRLCLEQWKNHIVLVMYPCVMRMFSTSYDLRETHKALKQCNNICIASVVGDFFLLSLLIMNWWIVKQQWTVKCWEAVMAWVQIPGATPCWWNLLWFSFLLPEVFPLSSRVPHPTPLTLLAEVSFPAWILAFTKSFV